MNILLTILSLKLSGSIFILALLLFKPLYAKRLSKRWQYYIWLVVIVRLLLPFTFEINLIGNFFNEINQTSIAVFEEVRPTNIENENFSTERETSVATNNGETINYSVDSDTQATILPQQDNINIIWQHCQIFG